MEACSRCYLPKRQALPFQMQQLAMVSGTEREEFLPSFLGFQVATGVMDAALGYLLQVLVVCIA